MPHGGIARALIKRVKKEQLLRDSECGEGNFAASALIEFLYRYWLESELYNLGFDGIEREVLYPPDHRSKKGRQRSCDLRFKRGESIYWLELKVAYSNTRYSRNELVSDIEKLAQLPETNGSHQVKRVYVVVFISEGNEVPLIMKGIIEAAAGVGAALEYESSYMPTPGEWKGWKNSHIHIGCLVW